MAADLTLLRSRLLLPADTTDSRDAASRAEALRLLLVGRAAISAAAHWLERRAQLGRDVFARGRPDEASSAKRGRAGDITALLRACLVMLALPDEAGAGYRVPAVPFWTVAEAVMRIRRLLPTIGAAGAGLGVFLPLVPAGGPDRDLRLPHRAGEHVRRRARIGPRRRDRVGPGARLRKGFSHAMPCRVTGDAPATTASGRTARTSRTCQPLCTASPRSIAVVGGGCAQAALEPQAKLTHLCSRAHERARLAEASLRVDGGWEGYKGRLATVS